SAGGLIQAWLQNGSARSGLERVDALFDEPRATGVPANGASWTWSPAGRDAPLSLAPPARIAIVGPSGCGKTSFVERLIGLRRPIAGELTLGGAERGSVGADQALARFAYAAQDVRLLDGTVRQNLALADPLASESAMWVALEDAGLAERLRMAPTGLDTPAGPNGAFMSGGERRRLGLARAYLKDAPWLVLDEPTEGLDRATERVVLERLDQRLRERGQGLIVITHRAPALSLCRVVVSASGMDGAGRLLAKVHTPGLERV
ncbi:MAG: ATP-binding cassette domain-containing protein, partial [Brevundimonas sp.]